MPPAKAKLLSGYSQNGNNMPEPVDMRTVSEIRERLIAVAGVTPADQVGWYAGIRDNPAECTSDRIAAAKQIDKVLGYEAPAKVEVSERREIAMAVQVLHSVTAQTGMSPRELVKLAQPAQIETHEIADFDEIIGAKKPVEVVGA